MLVKFYFSTLTLNSTLSSSMHLLDASSEEWDGLGVCRTALEKPHWVHLWITRYSWRTWLTCFAQRSSSVLFLIGQGSAGDKAGPAIHKETKNTKGKKKRKD